MGLLALATLQPVPVAAQTGVDQADPSVVVEETRRAEGSDAPRNGQPKIESTPSASDPLPDGDLLVGAIRVEGNSMLPAAAFASAIDAFVGRSLDPEALRDLASAIADVARKRGYGLASAWIPPQTLEKGILTVVLDEGIVHAVRVTGPGASAAMPILAPLANGRPVRTADLERRLLLAGDVAGVTLGKARLERTSGTNILVATAARERTQLRLYADNWGSNSIGPVRIRLAMDLNGVLAADDRVTIGSAVTPLQPREFKLISARYEKRLGTGGTEFHLEGYYAATHAGGYLRSRDISGRSAYLETGISHALVRSRSGSIWGHLDVAYLASRQRERDHIVRDDRIVAAAASVYASVGSSKGRLRGRASLRQGLDVLDSTQKGDRMASRRDADGIFTKVEFWASYDKKLSRSFSLGLQAQGQLADGPLLSSEEMGLGGRYFLRGYDYRELSGDKGIAGVAELRFDLPGTANQLKAVQLYVYADAGTVGNYRGGFGSGSLASSGGGARLRLEHDIDLGLEIGVPLKRGPFGTGRYDPRISVTGAARF